MAGSRLVILVSCILLGLVLGSRQAHAVQPDEILTDPKLEARARNLSAGLRCLVCQNQSIDDSDAPLAKDLRLLVRERLKAGDSDDEVITYVVARYGEFVLLRPALGPHTMVLWLGPFVILLLASWFLVRSFRRRRRAAEAMGGPVELTADERARLREVLSSDEQD